MIPVRFKNGDRSLALEVEPRRVRRGDSVRVMLDGKGIDGAVVFATGRVLGRLRQEATQQGRTVFCVLHDPTLVDRFADLVVSIDPNDPHGWRIRPVRR